MTSFKIRTKESNFQITPMVGQRSIGQFVLFDNNSPLKSCYPCLDKELMLKIVEEPIYKDVAIVYGGDYIHTTRLCYINEIVEFFSRIIRDDTILEIFVEGKEFPIRIEFPIERYSSVGFYIYAHQDTYDKIISMFKDRHDPNDEYTAKTLAEKIREIVQS